MYDVSKYEDMVERECRLMAQAHMAATPPERGLRSQIVGALFRKKPPSQV